MLQVITVCVEDIVDPRDSELQQLACQFVLWVLENANEDVVAAVAQPILDGAIYALNLLTVAAPTSSPPIRKMLYQAVGQIAEVMLFFPLPDMTPSSGALSALLLLCDRCLSSLSVTLQHVFQTLNSWLSCSAHLKRLKEM